MSAARDNAGKPALAQLLLFLPALEELSRHCDAGRAKYPDLDDGTPNWTLGQKPDDEYLDAAMRHLAAHVGGDLRDSETGTLHVTAATWNLLALVTLNLLADTEPDPDTEVSEPEDEGTPLRYNGEEGRLFSPTDPGHDYCVWLSSQSGKKARMTGIEWERAIDAGAAEFIR